MYQFKEHITLKIAAAFLVVALLMPSAVKLSHAFADHEHKVCTATLAEHIHEIDLDCDFYKFQKTGESYLSLNYEGLECHIKIGKPETSYYAYLNSHQQFNITLRGPPAALI